MSSAMKDTGIPWTPEIPVSWDIRYGKWVLNLMQRAVRDDDEVVTCFRDGEVILRTLRRTDGFTMSDKEIGYQGVNIGDIVIHGMDGFAGAMGISKSQGKSTPVYVVCTTKNNHNERYIIYYLRSLAHNDVFLSLSTGIRERSCDLKWNKISVLPFILPDHSEQQSIADFLDVKCAEVDELVALQERMIDELKVYKQSVITEAVTKGLNPDAPLKDSGIEWIGQIPEHWSIERLKNRIYKSFAGIWGDDAQNNDNDVRCYRVADFDYNQLNISENNPTKRNIEKSVFEQRKVLFNDILLEKSGGGEKSPVGRAVYVNLEEDAICSNFVHCIRVDKNSISKFFVYVFSNMYNRKVNQLYFNQTTGIQNLNVSDYLNNTLCFPPIEEQQQIADYLDKKCAEIDEMTCIKQQKIELLKEYKKSIIYEYVTGKKQVNIE